MAPTIQNGSSNEVRTTATTRPTEKKSDLICRVKYSNTLPDIPFDLKFLIYPFESNRFIQYNPTSLEKNYKYEVLTEHDLGVTIDLINRDIYYGDSHAGLDPADEKLLEEDSHAPQDSVRSRQHSRPVSWLRKSEYISTEQTRFQPQNIEKIEAKVGYNVKKSLREETLVLDRDAQIQAIEKTFEDSKMEINRHYSKSNVHPVEVLPVYPDFNNWKYPCAQVIFDSDPAPVGKSVAAQIESMSQAMIRGVMNNDTGEQFVAYFLVEDETLEKRRNDAANKVLYQEDQTYEYKIAREYNWNVKNKSTKGYEENYFFTIRDDGVYYNELETRVRLSKRRVKFGQQPNNTKLVVRHRPLNENEFKQQRYREKQLEVPASDDEEEMEVDEEPEQETITATDDKERSRSRSVSRSKSRSRSGSRSRSRSKSGSRSRSRSKSASKSRSRSVSRSKSKSVSKSRSRSRSRSRSKSHSKSHSKSRSRSKSRSTSRSVSRSRSRSNSARSSKSRSRSRSRSSSGSRGSGKKSRSASRSSSSASDSE